MCLDDPRSLQLIQGVDKDSNSQLLLSIKFADGLDSATKEYIRGLSKRFVFYSKTHAYQMDEFS